MEYTQIDLLRKKLIELQLERENIILEKGLAARENNDLRENFEYDYWERKEHVLTIRIKGILKEIHDLAQIGDKAQATASK